MLVTTFWILHHRANFFGPQDTRLRYRRQYVCLGHVFPSEDSRSFAMFGSVIGDDCVCSASHGTTAVVSEVFTRVNPYVFVNNKI